LLDGSDMLHDNLGTLEELSKKTSLMERERERVELINRMRRTA